MQRATISVSEGRFPEAHFGNRRIMEPSIGYAITRLSAQARSLGTGITVEVDDRGTRLSLTIDEEGRLHTPPGAWAQADAPTEARSDASAATQALPVVPDGSSAPQQSQQSQQSGLERARAESGTATQDPRRTFTQDWRPAPAMTVPDRRAEPRTGAQSPQGSEHGAIRPESATSEQDPHGFHPTLEHSNHALALAPHAAPNPPQTRSNSETPTRSGSETSLQPNPETSMEPGSQPRLARTGIIAMLVVAALALCGAGLLLL